MGCTNSKLDDLPAVSLCRQRCSFLDEAIRHRYSLADSHLAYLHSLKSLGSSLYHFFESDPERTGTGDGTGSPVLNLPNHRKLAAEPPPQKHHHPHHHSHSGSHLHFHSDSDSDSEHDLGSGSGSDSPIHHHRDHDSGNSSPVVHNNNNYGGGISYNYDNYAENEALSQYPLGGFMNTNNMNINYMRNKATPSVLYEQRPVTAETVQMGESSSSSYYPYSAYPNYNDNPKYNENPNYYSYYNGGGGGERGGNDNNYNNNNNNNGFYGPGPGYGGGSYMGSLLGTGYDNGNRFLRSGPGYGGGSYMGPSIGGGNSEASSSKPPPPPPSPPRGSAWDFLYPFENYESFYPPHTPSSRSRDSKEVREEEGIPDLEDEHEVVKEAYRDHKFSQGGEKSYSEELAKDHSGSKGIDPDPMYENRPSVVPVAVDNDPVEYEVHVVDKKVVGGEERSRDNVAAFKASADSDVVREIQLQFDRASESGTELAKILEVGKFPYKKSAASHVSSKVLQVIIPSLPHHSNSESSAIDKSYEDEDVVMKSSNLSSTLHKLYLWEKKLYEEVKVEEKMRVLHERKCRKLKQLDERGAEAQKIDTTRILIRSLSTKIRMAIQVVDRTSVTINKLRDEELWPQLNEVVQGLARMWKAMLECHRIQLQAIGQAKRLDAVSLRKHFSDAQLEATMQLEHELLIWTLRFSCWVGAQKGFVRALNSWLMKCLLYVPEETPDGIIPFSPGRLGAPLIFVICNQWAQAMDRISEKEVVESTREFATSVLHLWERDKLEMRQRMMTNKDMERKVKTMEKEDQKIHKEIQALDKRIVLVSGADSGLSTTGNVVYQSETSKNGSLQLSLQRIFAAMERFVSSSVNAYDELLQRIEEDRRDRLATENQKE